MHLYDTATSIAAPIGGLLLVTQLYKALSTLWLYTRPSRFSRYAHTTDGKTPWALITGSTGGIGVQLVHELAQRGFNIVLHGRSPAKLQSLEKELLAQYPDREFRKLVFDASEAGAGAELNNQISALGDINLTVVINNAGGATDRTFYVFDQHNPERIMYDATVNALFPMHIMRYTTPLLARNAPGLIINLGSMGEIGLPYGGSYSASKMFLTRMSETMSLEMRMTGRDIEVLCVKIGNVWGTGQTIAEAPGLLVPDAQTMARMILARVGCGRRSVAGHWAHGLQIWVITLLPDRLLQWLLIDMVKHVATPTPEKKTM